jgi:hypothetical protein
MKSDERQFGLLVKQGLYRVFLLSPNKTWQLCYIGTGISHDGCRAHDSDKRNLYNLPVHPKSKFA